MPWLGRNSIWSLFEKASPHDNASQPREGVPNELQADQDRPDPDDSLGTAAQGKVEGQ